MAVTLDERPPDDERLQYRPTYLADRVLVGIVIGGILAAAVIAWAVVVTR